MREPILNVALLRVVQNAILDAPTQFHIGEWHLGDVWPGATDKVSGSACLVGWTVALGPRVRLSLLTGAEIERLGRDALGLSQTQAARLFLLSEWPGEFQELYRFDPKTLADYQSNARLASGRIEFFISTGR